jgi:hypothetical protein
VTLQLLSVTLQLLKLLLLRQLPQLCGAEAAAVVMGQQSLHTRAMHVGVHGEIGRHGVLPNVCCFFTTFKTNPEMRITAYLKSFAVDG